MNINNFPMKFSMFISEENLCILHGQVFVMIMTRILLQEPIGIPLLFGNAAVLLQRCIMGLCVDDPTGHPTKHQYPCEYYTCSY